MAAYLVTTSHHVLAFDGEECFYRVHSGQGLYYGLAQNDDQIYVACRNNPAAAYDAPGANDPAESILVLEAGSLRPVDELLPKDFTLRNVHGIAFFDDRLWVTSSSQNLIAIFDPSTHHWSKWYPAIDATARDHDVNHFNTICPVGDRIYLVAHNRGRSQLLAYDRRSLELCSVYQLGCHAHDIFQVGESIATCSSIEGRVVGTCGWTYRTGAFPRGIARDDRCILVGISQMAKRSARSKKTGVVRKFSREWQPIADHVLPGAGMVLAILPIELSSTDMALLEAFPSQRYRGGRNPVEPGNVYRFGVSDFGGSSILGTEWHAAEDTHRWTGAREARMKIVVNPGEGTLVVNALSAFPGAYWTEIVLNSQTLGRLSWRRPGTNMQEFSLPTAEGECELVFKVPHLWQPCRYAVTADERWLGVGLKDLRLL